MGGEFGLSMAASSPAAAAALASASGSRPALTQNYSSAGGGASGSSTAAASARRALQLDTSFAAPEGSYRCVASLLAPSYSAAGSLVTAGLKLDPATGAIVSAADDAKLNAAPAPPVFSPNNPNSGAGALKAQAAAQAAAAAASGSGGSAAGGGGAGTSAAQAPAERPAAPTILQLVQASAAAYQQYVMPSAQLSCAPVRFPMSKTREKEQARARAAAAAAGGPVDGADEPWSPEEGNGNGGGGALSMGLGIGRVGAGLRRGMGLGGAAAGGGGEGSGGGALHGVPAHLQSSAASWTRALMEATLGAQGIDYPPHSTEQPLAGIALYREGLAAQPHAHAHAHAHPPPSPAGPPMNGGAGDESRTDAGSSVLGGDGSSDAGRGRQGARPSSSSNSAPAPHHAHQQHHHHHHHQPAAPPLHTLLSAPASSSAGGGGGGLGSGVGRPKNNFRSANSTFVTRLTLHSDFGKIMAARNVSGEAETFAFVSTGRTLTWLLDAGALRSHVAKEPLARFGFATNITAHDVHLSTRSAAALDVVVGFQTGDLVWMDPIALKYTRINKGGAICSSPVTAVRWLPGTEGAILAAHADGSVIIYEAGRDDSAGPGKETGFFPKSSLPVYVRRMDEDAATAAAAAAAPPHGLVSSPTAQSFRSRSAQGDDSEAVEVLVAGDSSGEQQALTGSGGPPAMTPLSLSERDNSASPLPPSSPASERFRRPDLARTLTNSTATSAAQSDFAAGGGAGLHANGFGGAGGAVPPGLGALSHAELLSLGGPGVLGIADVWDPQASMLVTQPGMPTGHPLGPNLIDVVAAGAAAGPKKEPAWSKLNPVSHWQVSRSKITGLAFSPDASLLAITSEDGYLRVVDVQGQRLLDTFSSYFGGFTCAAWSPDGRFLATGGQDDLITVFAPREGRVLARCQGHTSFVTSIAFDPWRWKTEDRTYRFGSVGEDGKLALWDFSSATLHRPKGHAHGAQSTMGAAHRASVLGSTYSLVGAASRGAVLERHHHETHGETLLHPAPLRSETAMLLPIVAHQLEGNGVSTLTQIRFRPEGIVVLHRDGGLDTFLRPNVDISQLTGQASGGFDGSGTRASQPSRPGSSRSRGLSFGLRKNTLDNVAAVK